MTSSLLNNDSKRKFVFIIQVPELLLGHWCYFASLSAGFPVPSYHYLGTATIFGMRMRL